MASHTLRTLDRGLVALGLVAQADDGLKVAEIAQRLDVDRAIAYRIVATLSENAMVQRLPDGRIILGSGAIVLAAHAEGAIRTLARPVVEHLAEQTGATAFLSMAQGAECVAILTAEPRNAFLNIHYRVGTRHPIDKGAAGLAILSGRPAHPDDPESVSAARREGYSTTRGELQKGAVGVSSPVTSPHGKGGAFEFSIGVVALDDLDLDRATGAVMQAARKLSALLGAPRPA